MLYAVVTKRAQDAGHFTAMAMWVCALDDLSGDDSLQIMISSQCHGEVIPPHRVVSTEFGAAFIWLDAKNPTCRRMQAFVWYPGGLASSGAEMYGNVMFSLNSCGMKLATQVSASLSMCSLASSAVRYLKRRWSTGTRGHNCCDSSTVTRPLVLNQPGQWTPMIRSPVNKA